jgi:hypothetical protein
MTALKRIEKPLRKRDIYIIYIITYMCTCATALAPLAPLAPFRKKINEFILFFALVLIKKTKTKKTLFVE